MKSLDNSFYGLEYVFAALSGMGAACFTNPVDVIKIRLQLQGELERRGSYKKIYKNTFHTAYLIGKHEGFLALQSGFIPALGYQIFLNGTRLGTYHFCKNTGIILNEKGEIHILKTSLISGCAGIIGGIVGSPFFLVKTHLQSQSESLLGAKNIAVGCQHHYTGTWSAFKHIWTGGGFYGIYRGWYANSPKTFFGSATQMTVFGLATDWLRPFEVFEKHPLFLTFFASLMSGCSLAIVMQPFDVLSTRLYNQGVDDKGKGLYYSGLFDGLYKVFKIEGVFGLYKGIFPTWMRSAPHVILCQVFYENLQNLYKGFYKCPK